MELKPVMVHQAMSTSGPRRLTIGIVTLGVRSAKSDVPSSWKPVGRILEDAVRAHPAVDAVGKFRRSVVSAVNPRTFDGLIVTWSVGKQPHYETAFDVGTTPALVAHHVKDAVTGGNSTSAALWADESPAELAGWLNWLSNQSASSWDRVHELVEALVGVVNHVIVDNEELRIWADALADEVTDLNSSIDEWQIYARNLKLIIAELTAKNQDLWAQLGQRRFGRKRLAATVTGLATAVGLLQGPMVYEWYDDHFTGNAAKPPASPTISEIIEMVGERCAAIELEISDEPSDAD